MSIILQPAHFGVCEDCNCVARCKPNQIARPTDYFTAQLPETIPATDYYIVDCCSGTWVSNLDSNDVTIYSGYSDIKFKWSKYGSLGDVLKVCYEKDFLINPEFDTEEGWETTGTGIEWSLGTGAAEVILGASETSKYLQQDLDLEICEYDVDIRVTGNAGGVNTIFIYDSERLLYTITQNYLGYNDYNFHWTPDYPNQTLYVAVQADGVGNTTTINYIKLTAVTCSDCYEIGEHNCSMLIQATNDQDSFNLASTFEANLRIYGKLHKIKPEYTENIYRNTNGKFINVNTDLVLIYEFETFMLYTDVIQALLVVLCFDNVTIDGVEYVKKESNIELSWDNKYEYAKFKTDLYLKEQLLRKEYT